MNIHPLLDPEKQAQARRYEKEKRRLALTGSTINLLLILAFYFSGFSSTLANLQFGNSIAWTFLFYMIVLMLTFSIAGVPLGFYSGYLHEHKWGFSNHTVKSWFWDELKSFCVITIFLLVITGFLFWIWQVSPGNWWLWSGMAAAGFGVILATIFPVVILPLFNDYDPIEDSELVRKLSDILGQAGLKASGFYVQDMSRQTKKENAFLTGLGKTRRVVLADNLIKNMAISEIAAVIAHEVGHYRHRHIWKQILIGSIQQFILFYILDQIMAGLFPHFLESTVWNLTLFPLFILTISLLSTLLFSPPNKTLSRYFERQADHVSLELTGDRKAFQIALAGLANRNLSNAYPPWWVKIFYYSHSPIGERLDFALKYYSTNPPVD